jgi:hypothetical protein
MYLAVITQAYQEAVDKLCKEAHVCHKDPVEKLILDAMHSLFFQWETKVWECIAPNNIRGSIVHLKKYITSCLCLAI